MKKIQNSGDVYVVVNVWRGFAVGAEIFHRRANAVRRFNKLVHGNHLRENDVQIFKTTLKAGRACRDELVAMDVPESY